MKLSFEEKRELLNELKKELQLAKKVYVTICRDNIELPKYANIGDAGMDIRAAEDVLINPGETKIIPTGLKMAIPDGFEIQVRPRSGLTIKTPLRIANAPGTIDSGYRDEVGIIINNSSPVSKEEQVPTYGIDEKGNKYGAYQIKKNDRIAQIVLSKFETIEFEETDDIESIGLNRGGGFGSSGLK